MFKLHLTVENWFPCTFSCLELCWFVWYMYLCWWNKSTGGLSSSIPEGNPRPEVLQAGRPGARHSEYILSKRGTWCCRRCACLGKSAFAFELGHQNSIDTPFYCKGCWQEHAKKRSKTYHHCQCLYSIQYAKLRQLKIQQGRLELETHWSHIQAWW